jgi:L-rhamnose mutarotase
MRFLLKLKKFFMQRIESIEELKRMGRKVQDNQMTYKIHIDDTDYQIFIFKDNKKIFEFVCNRDVSQEFLDAAIQF